MSNVKVVSDDEEFNSLLKEAENDLVVIDFFTTWCKPCREIQPVFEAMAVRYPKALFLKVDADKCFNTAMNYKVTGVPFFAIYFNKTVVETVQGASQQELELKIRLADIESRRAVAAQKHSLFFPSSASPVISTFGKLGGVTPFVDLENSRCINDLSPTSFHNFLGGKKLVSGKGTGKLLLLYTFTQKMMLQSFKIKANAQSGPKVLRFFVNFPKVLDFNVAATLAPSQEVTLNPNDLTGERAIELRSGSFQMVTNIQIFVTCGQQKNSKIEIESLLLFGAPVLGVQPLISQAPIIATSTVSETSDVLSPKDFNEIDAMGEEFSCPSCVVPASSPNINENRYMSHSHYPPHDQTPGHSRAAEINQNQSSGNKSRPIGYGHHNL